MIGHTSTRRESPDGFDQIFFRKRPSARLGSRWLARFDWFQHGRSMASHLLGHDSESVYLPQACGIIALIPKGVSRSHAVLVSYETLIKPRLGSAGLRDGLSRKSEVMA